MSKKKKKGLSTNAKWGIALLVEIPILALMVLLFVFVYLAEKYEKVQYEDIPEEEIVVNDGANKDQEKYTQIALFGIDARDNTSMKEGNRTDCIIIASINNDTHEVKLVSVYRDSLLEILQHNGSFKRNPRKFKKKNATFGTSNLIQVNTGDTHQASCAG